MDFNSHASSSIIRLNIGGKKFCTTTDTLTQREPESMLAAMFSGRHTLCQDSSDQGYVFLDRDGKHFRHILNWLRDGVVPILKDYQYSELLHEAEYFQLLGLIDGIKTSLNMRKEDERVGPDITRADVIRCTQSDRLRFRGVNLSGLDLSKLDLSEVDFSYACLRNVLFSHANLRGAKFMGADLTNANLKGANLGKAILVADLTNATLEGANLRGATLCKAVFTNANLKGANLGRANLEEAIFTGAILRDANLQNAGLRYANLHRADLEGAKLDGADLSRTFMR